MKFEQKLVIVCVLIVLSAANVFGAHRHKKADPRDAKIAELKEQIAQKDQVIAQKDQVVTQKDQLIAQINAQLTQKGQQLTQNDQLSKQKDAQLGELRSKVAELTEKLDQFKTCIAHCIEHEELLKKAQDDALSKQQKTETTKPGKTGLALLVEYAVDNFEGPISNVN